MGIKDILGYDWETVSHMKRSELAKVTSQLASAANKRLKRFEIAGEVSPAYRQAEKAGKFSVAGKNLNQLRAEFVRARDYLQSETSSLRQWSVVKNETVKTLEGMGVSIPKEDVAEVMRLYGRVKSEFPDLVQSEIYAPVVQGIYDQMQDGVDPDQIVDDARQMMIQGYEQRERLNYDFETGGVSDFF